MTARHRILYCLNQFFAGLGGEEKAALPPEIARGARGPGILLQKLFPDLEVTETVIVGDNYIARHTAAAVSEVLALLEPCFASGRDRPVLLLAGPAFNAGRYGLACGAVCRAVRERYSIPAATAMFPDNPAVSEYRKHVIICRSGPDVLSLEESVRRMGALGLKLLHGEEILPERDEYIPQGRRRNFFADRPGAMRALDMLLSKLEGRPFATEYPMPVFDRVKPAPAVRRMAEARLGLVTSGGIVPLGNPDRIAAANAQRFGVYPLEGLTTLSPQTHQTAHGGYDPTFANQDPNRVLPLDAVRELQAEGAIGALHEYYYATVGNATSVDKAAAFGGEIARLLLRDGVQAVILTST